MLSFVTLASGSSGNAALVSCGQTHILLDAGISARRITTALRGLGVEPKELSGPLSRRRVTYILIMIITAMIMEMALPKFHSPTVIN